METMSEREKAAIRLLVEYRHEARTRGWDCGPLDAEATKVIDSALADGNRIPAAGIYETIRAIMAGNIEAGRHEYDGLTSAQIGEYNRRLMFGENDEAFPDPTAWSSIVD